MNEQPRRTLKRLIDEYGTDLVNDPRSAPRRCSTTCADATGENLCSCQCPEAACGGRTAGSTEMDAQRHLTHPAGTPPAGKACTQRGCSAMGSRVMGTSPGACLTAAKNVQFRGLPPGVGNPSGPGTQGSRMPTSKLPLEMQKDKVSSIVYNLVTVKPGSLMKAAARTSKNAVAAQRLGGQDRSRGKPNAHACPCHCCGWGHLVPD